MYFPHSQAMPPITFASPAEQEGYSFVPIAWKQEILEMDMLIT